MDVLICSKILTIFAGEFDDVSAIWENSRNCWVILRVGFPLLSPHTTGKNSRKAIFCYFGAPNFILANDHPSSNPFSTLKVHHLSMSTGIRGKSHVQTIKWITRWWLNQPIWNILVKMGLFPQIGWNKTYLKPPPRSTLNQPKEGGLKSLGGILIKATQLHIQQKQ